MLYGQDNKNPLNPRWRTFWNEQPRFELNYLCEFIDTNKRVKKVRKSIVAEGRNTALFDTLRFYAYSIILNIKKMTISAVSCQHYKKKLKT